MKNFRNVFFLLGFFINSCNTSNINSDKQIITQLFDNYKKNTIDENFEVLYDLIYPEVFNGIDKKEKIEDVRSSMHNPNYDITISKINNDSLYQVEKYGPNRYSMIAVTSKATYFFKKMPKDSLAYIKQFGGICNRMKDYLGEQNVSCDQNRGAVNAVIKSNAYFIFDIRYKKWFILSDDKPADVERFIPLEIRRRFGTENK